VPTPARRSPISLSVRALSEHPPYFHNGSAATLEDVVSMYDAQQSLGLSKDQRADLAEYI
jgi:cytochrome c peroxidase